MGGGIEPDAPPPGEWIYLPGEEGKQTVYQDDYNDFSLKCEVIDNKGNTAVDIHSVVINNLSVQQTEDEIQFAVIEEEVAVPDRLVLITPPLKKLDYRLKINRITPPFVL